MKRKTAVIACSALLALLITGGSVCCMNRYMAAPDMIKTESTEKVEVFETNNYLLYDNQDCSDTAIIFYGGARVDEKAYTYLANELSEKTDVFLLNCKSNFPILERNLADSVVKEYGGQYQTIYLAGHSMGGAAAGLYTINHPKNNIKGVIYLASYSTDVLPPNVKQVIYIYGNNDKVVVQEKQKEDIERNQKNPDCEVTVVEIAGGNHAGFGCYGKQDSDGVANISNEEQIQEAVRAIFTWMLSAPKET